MEELVRTHGVKGVLELLGQVCENMADDCAIDAEARAWRLDATSVYSLAMKVQR